MFFTGHSAGIGHFRLIQGQNKVKSHFLSEKRPPRANPRRSENPLFMRFISDYSMIEATLPEPTVLPPSRYQTGVLRCANGDFSCDLCGKIRIFRCVRVVLGDFVIMVLSSPLNNTMIHNLCNAFCALYNFFFSPFFLVFIFFYKFFHCCILRFWVSCHF